MSQVELISQANILAELDDWLVEKAERIVWEVKDRLEEHSETQAQKAIEVAAISYGSVRLFRNWLRYQWARESSQELWSVRKDDKDRTIAEKITAAIDEIDSKVKAKAPSASEQERYRITMQAAARFLGYFKRALKAVNYLDRIKPMLEGGERR